MYAQGTCLLGSLEHGNTDHAWPSLALHVYMTASSKVGICQHRTSQNHVHVDLWEENSSTFINSPSQ